MGCDVTSGAATVFNFISIHAPQWGATILNTRFAKYLKISIHAPQWGATVTGIPFGALKSGFQSTHPSGVRLNWGVADILPDEISIHAPQWGATTTLGVQLLQIEFQSTHPSGVRLSSSICFSFHIYFNPRTPVGCDASFSSAYSMPYISIHAPQWGATFQQDVGAPQFGFQSTHPSGVRLGHRHRPTDRQDFNPRTPVGCDLPRNTTTCNGIRFQSTHPSGVRRFVKLIATCNPVHFNPRTPVGCDSYARGLCHVPSHFNPRTPVGCDVGKMWARPFRRHHFNPRTPVGCDEYRSAIINVDMISIHAPQWGATRAYSAFSRLCNNFNPRTPVGCDLGAETVDKATTLFQSTHPSGVRPSFWPVRMFLLPFQSTHPSGVRRELVDIVRTMQQFQSTHPSGVRRIRFQRGSPHIVISIHAPQWGATHAVSWTRGINSISIHAPQWGATASSAATPWTRSNFNPRTPVGCDKKQQETYTLKTYFNPRTPVGCDGQKRSSPRGKENFNPRTPVGCDQPPPSGKSGA